MLDTRINGKIWGETHYNICINALVAKDGKTTAIDRLGRVQRIICKGIAGAMRTTQTIPLETLLPLHIVIRGETGMPQFRLENSTFYKCSGKL